MRRLGVHVSIAGGVEKGLIRARDLGCTTLQFFSHNPRGWAIKEKGKGECEEFRRLTTEYNISPAFIHTSYLINLAASNSELLRKSASMVKAELDIADALGSPYIVLHTGSASGDLPEKARERAIKCLLGIAQTGTWKARILLENTAGERGDITSRISEIGEIIKETPQELVGGICLDTCHAFAAGYDLRTSAGLDDIASEILQHAGKEGLKLIHLNDSKGDIGSGLDRHHHIGEGKLGLGAIKKIVAHPFFRNTPLVLETPKKTDDDDPRNLALVRSII